MASRMKWVATPDSSKSEPKPSSCPMLFYGFNTIFRASGEKTTTVSYKGADSGLIEADKKNNNRFHYVK